MNKNALIALAAIAMANIVAPAAAQASEASVLGTWTDRKGNNFIFSRGGEGKIEQTRPINGNPGKIATKISWSLNGASDKLTYKLISTTLSGSAGYDQTKPASGKSFTVGISISSSKLVINGQSWYKAN